MKKFKGYMLAITFLVCLISTANTATAQNKIQVITPGDLKIDPSRIKSARIDLVDNYGSYGYTSIDHATYNGKPALVIQSWFLMSNNYLDYLIVDASNFSVLYRSAPANGANENEDMMTHQQGDAQLVTIFKDGQGTTSEVNESGPFFNISSFPHLFSQMDLKKGYTFKLKSFDPYNGKVNEPEFYVEGKVTVKDAKGNSYKVWAVDLLQKINGKEGIPDGTVAARTRYLVSDEAPYYFGMEMSQVKSRDDLTLVKGYTQTMVGYTVIENAPSAETIKKFLREQ